MFPFPYDPVPYWDMPVVLYVSAVKYLRYEMSVPWNIQRELLANDDRLSCTSNLVDLVWAEP